MTKREFAVSVESLSYTRDELYIACRILNGTVAVGDRFSLLSSSHDGTDSANDTSVDLTVLEIGAYRKSFSCIDTGMTCQLKLGFDSPPRLSTRDFLLGSSDCDSPTCEVLGEVDSHVP